MRFLCVYKPTKAEGTPPSPQEMATMGALVEEGMRSGKLLMAEGCLPTAMGARVRQANGKIIVTDGPFTETREQIGGLAVIQAGSKPEAIEYIKEFLKVAGDGESEIRQLHEVPAAAAQ